ncbi:protein of unknown function [Acetoanaerobium sticklandii]|uniref:Uncharacterized protein n=1 Tax=Acetoanaerobium sticklandii (strain ATCC 12662 / DSM 519 / JCM 1433 / CCUG 9281 / NCIMB 10654 / HF) TaxID=499177 RepID=E3PY65_ACESD|nr:hypothetical protein [Acetoanaerobium sticklandii]CBH21380.1 protein of unknown function [Acetoanaerobium sticklandii]
MKFDLRKEHLEILTSLKELGATSFLDSVAVKEIQEKMNEKDIKASSQFLKKYIKIFESLEIVKKGLLARGNAKTYYLDLENHEEFLVKVNEKYNK